MHKYNEVPVRRKTSRVAIFFKAALLSVLLLTGSTAFALDVNKATSAELQTIEGVGPVIAERILKERSRGGKFSSTANLIERVKGVGDKTAGRITSGSGLKKGVSSTTSNKASSKAASSKKPKKPSDTKSTNKTVSGKATEGKAEKGSSRKKSAAKKSTAKKASTSKASTKTADTKAKPAPKSAKKSTKKTAKKKSAKKTTAKKKSKKKAKKKAKKKSSSS